MAETRSESGGSEMDSQRKSVPIDKQEAVSVSRGEEDQLVEEATKTKRKLDEEQETVSNPNKKADQKVVQKERKVKAKKLRSTFATQKNELFGWPLPLTLEEAKNFKLEVGTEFKSKNEFISRLMSKNESIQKRFNVIVSRPDTIHVKCPFPTCKLDIACGLRRKTGIVYYLNYFDVESSYICLSLFLSNRELLYKFIYMALV